MGPTLVSRASEVRIKPREKRRITWFRESSSTTIQGIVSEKEKEEVDGTNVKDPSSG